MLILIKNGPDTPEGKRGLQLALDMCADICLLQNAVYFAQKERLEGVCGKVYVLEEDKRLRGLNADEMEKDILPLDYDGLVDIMDSADKVAGIF
ncbi:MAG: hypothetical protein EPN22_04020 [Nitrospirae bacterium]|nr:MAG: hypothetical protein EPN22_04020 [Nitrospirota bacterium]